MLVLEVFPGIGLLGKGFEQAGYCVVRGPDLLWGGDIRRFHAPAGRFDGVIGGPPCQDFSADRREPATGYGMAMLAEFERVVLEAAPAWWLMENVSRVPDLHIAGYTWQRLDLRASEFGLNQSRLRHFQFGSRDGRVLVLPRPERLQGELEPCCMATEGNKKHRRTWEQFCELQGLPPDFDLPGMTKGGRYAAVGNGVPVPMGEAVARAIQAMPPAGSIRVCLCGCGRPVKGKAESGGAACRKRLQRRRDSLSVTGPGEVTARPVTRAGVTQRWLLATAESRFRQHQPIPGRFQLDELLHSPTSQTQSNC